MDIDFGDDSMVKIYEAVAGMTPTQKKAGIEQMESIRKYLLNLHEHTKTNPDRMGHVQLDVKPGVQTSLCTEDAVREVHHYDTEKLKGIYLDRPLCPEARVPYDESPVEGFAILASMCAKGERHKRFLHDLTKEARHAALEYLAPLPEEERPLVSKTDFLDAIAYPRKDRFRSPSPDYDLVPALRPIHHIALHRVIDRHHPMTAKRGGEDFREITEPPKMLQPSNKRDYRQGIRFDYSTSKVKVIEDPKDISFTGFEIPTCDGYDQYYYPPGKGGKHVRAVWPTPYLARSEDMNHAYQLIRSVIDHANKSKYEGKLDLKYVKKILTPRQLENVRRWVRLENGEWLEEEDNELLELWQMWRERGKAHQAVYIGQELCMLTEKPIHQRMQSLKNVAGRKPFNPWNEAPPGVNKWLMSEYKENFESPNRYDIIYDKLRKGGYYISRRSIIRQVEKLLYETKIVTVQVGTEDPYDKFLDDYLKAKIFDGDKRSHHWLHKLIELWRECQMEHKMKGMKGGAYPKEVIASVKKEIKEEIEGVSNNDLWKMIQMAFARYKDVLNQGTGTMDYTQFENAQLLRLKKEYDDDYVEIAKRMPRRTKKSLHDQWKRWQGSGGLRAEQLFAADHREEMLYALKGVEAGKGAKY